jgi:hypothetical protein
VPRNTGKLIATTGAATPLLRSRSDPGFEKQNVRFISAGWVLHTAWDVVHHLYGNPIAPFLPLSSAGCAVCDLGLAAWYAAGAPSPYPWLLARRTSARKG